MKRAKVAEQEALVAENTFDEARRQIPKRVIRLKRRDAWYRMRSVSVTNLSA